MHSADDAPWKRISLFVDTNTEPRSWPKASWYWRGQSYDLWTKRCACLFGRRRCAAVEVRPACIWGRCPQTPGPRFARSAQSMFLFSIPPGPLSCGLVWFGWVAFFGLLVWKLAWTRVSLKRHDDGGGIHVCPRNWVRWCRLVDAFFRRGLLSFLFRWSRAVSQPVPHISLATSTTAGPTVFNVVPSKPL